MNETEFIRGQRALEREHLGAVARACADAAMADTPARTSTLAQFQQACLEYLDCVLGWYEERDRRVEKLAAGLDAEDPRCSTVAEILARRGSGREALEKLTAAGATPGGWPQFVRFLSGPWSARRDALEQLLANDSRAIDWRLIGGVDADGILEERRHYERVVTLLPAAVSLTPQPAREA
jgi:hypothetical protein